MTTEVVSIASLFVGIGAMALLFVFAYFWYQFSRGLKSDVDVEEKVNLLQMLSIEGVAKARGIDMERIAIERDLRKKKNFRRRLEEEMIKHMFDEKKEDKSK